MADELYDVVFQGKTQPGHAPEQVREQIGRLFNASPETLNRMFSGQAIVIKKGVDRATAEKYLQAMSKAGALVQLTNTEGKTADFADTSVKSVTPTPAPHSASASVETPSPATPKRKSVLNSLSVAALGEPLQQNQGFVPGKFNTDGMTMAPVGSDVTEHDAPPPPFQANLNGLSMAQAGERILDTSAKPVETRGTVFRYEWDE